jgi:hypothetical protein
VAQGNHTHNAAAITSGTLDFARLPVGAGSTQVAQGDHRHTNLPYFVGQVGTQISGFKGLGTQEASGITNTGTGLQVTVAGRYWVHFQQLTRTAGNATYLSITRNGGVVYHAYMPNDSFRDLVAARHVTLNVGDVIGFRVDVATPAEVWGGAHSSVSMYLTH